MITKYDDSSWHYNGNFPQDLPQSATAIHIGMFFTWAVLVGLGDSKYLNHPTLATLVKERQITPGQFFLAFCDGKFSSRDLNEEGDAFAMDYYRQSFVEDYKLILASVVDTEYHVANTWENYDLLKLVLDKRLADWRAA